MNNLNEIVPEEIGYVGPVQASYGRPQARIPLGQLSHGRTSRNIIRNMGYGVRYNPGAQASSIGRAPNVRGFAKHGTRSVSPPAPLKRLGGKRSTARRASRHARHRHGRRYRSRHTRR